PGPGPLRATTLRQFPALRGYVQTRAKSAAALELVVLAENRAEPLLASWRYGKGKSVAFTSDANGRWSNLWAAWPRFAMFWTELIEALRPEGGEDGEAIPFTLRYAVERGELVLDLAVFSEVVKGLAAGVL